MVPWTSQVLKSSFLLGCSISILGEENQVPMSTPLATEGMLTDTASWTPSPHLEISTIPFPREATELMEGWSHSWCGESDSGLLVPSLDVLLQLPRAQEWLCTEP